MAKKSVDTKAPVKRIGAFSFDSVEDPVERVMILEAMDAKGLTVPDVQAARVRGLDQNGNRMVIITTVDDVRIRYPIPQGEV